MNFCFNINMVSDSRALQGSLLRKVAQDVKAAKVFVRLKSAVWSVMLFFFSTRYLFVWLFGWLYHVHVHVLMFRKEFLKTCFNSPINDFTLVSLKLFLYTLDPHKYMNLKMYEFKLIATYFFRIFFSYTLCTWSHIRQIFFLYSFQRKSVI